MKIKLLTCLCVPATIMTTPLILTSCGNDKPVTSDTIPLEFLFIKDNELYGLTCPWDDPRIANCTKLFIPKNVVTVVDNSFANMGSQIKTIEFEDAGKDDPYPYPLFINEEAFMNSSAETIILPSRLTYVGPKAFQNCKKAKKLDLSAWSEIDGKSFVDNNPFVESKIFDGWPTEGGEIVYPGGCEKNDPDLYFILKGVLMPETWMEAPTLEDVSDNTFNMFQVPNSYEVYLTGLKDGATISDDTILIPSKVTTIAPLALDSDFVLPYARDNPKLTLKFDDGETGPLVTKIQAAAFFGDDNIKAIDLSNCAYLNQIGAYAFANCSLGYELVPQPDDSDLVKLPPNGLNKIKTIGIGAFYSNQIDTLKLGDCIELTQLSTSLCQKNMFLSSVELPSNVNVIGPMALQETVGNYRIDGDTKIYFDLVDPNIDFVGYRAFYHSTAQNIIIQNQDGIPKVISEEAFYKSKYVTKLIILSTFTAVLNRAFADLDSLKEIDLTGVKTVFKSEDWANTAFEGSPKNVTVNIDQDTDADDWKAFFKHCGVDEETLATWDFQ